MIVGDPITCVWIHRNVKVGRSELIRVTLVSRLCQFICVLDKAPRAPDSRAGLSVLITPLPQVPPPTECALRRFTY